MLKKQFIVYHQPSPQILAGPQFLLIWQLKIVILHNYNYSMRFGDYETLRKYEKFKEEIFSKKNKAPKKKSNLSSKKRSLFKPVTLLSFIHHPFFKRLIFLTFLGTSIYLLDQKGVLAYFRKTIIERNPQIFNPLISHTLTALKNDIEQRFISSKADNEKSLYFSSNELVRMIEEDYKVMKFRVRGRVLRKQSKSGFGIGSLRFGVKEQIEGINQEGKQMLIEKNCKFQIESLSFWGHKKCTVLKEQQTLESYKKIDQLLKDSPQFYENTCTRINLLNYLLESKPKYNQMMEQCCNRLSSLCGNIRQDIQSADMKTEKKMKNSFFLISL